MQKLIIFAFFSSMLFFPKAQQNEMALYLKGNALFLPILITNVGLEYQLSDKYTLQGDAFISPWKSFSGSHAQLYMGYLDGRYYFNKAFNRWYVGLNVGFGVFDFTKWNYTGTDKFQRGFSYMLGGVVGYQFQWKDRWNIDVFLGGGSSQGFYHGYEKTPSGSFIRYEGESGWNKSGEIIPYRGGVMISYKIK